MTDRIPQPEELEELNVKWVFCALVGRSLEATLIQGVTETGEKFVQRFIRGSRGQLCVKPQGRVS